MTTATQTETRTTHVYRVYIRATQQRIWDAITKTEFTERYGYAAPVQFDLRPGGRATSTSSEAMKAAGREMGFETPDLIVDGEVVECDPPRKLVQTWRMLMDPTTAAEPYTTLTYEITEDGGPGVCKLTVTHDVTGAPATEHMITGALEDQTGQGGGGWAWVLSDLKTLLETGNAFNG